ncbi:transposase [Streptomyces sp. NPDC056159]|uniref:transposase n=1 Tax=Streptomyces sp. NPDC056159 TaxID=3155537 RepID=UPI003449C444
MNEQFAPRGCTVTLSQHDLFRLLESLRSADGLELVHEVAERLLQELIEAEATAKIGAEWGEHTDTRTTWRNGHREKTVTTQAGLDDLQQTGVTWCSHSGVARGGADVTKSSHR